MHLNTLAILTLCSLGPVTLAENWPTWRGPRGDGTSTEIASPPIHWSQSTNITWKTPVPGKGHASPIAWENRIFTVSALLDTEERILLCFDRKSGRQLWQKTVTTSSLEGKHGLNSYASSTPATDGKQVYVSFLEGDQVLVAAYDLSGQQKWVSRPGTFNSMHGFCSSPVLYDDLVIINADHDGDGYIVALDRQDGRPRWHIERPNKTRSYCVPTIFQVGGRTQMVVSGTLCVAAYDPNNGQLQWIIDGPTEQYVASLVYNAKANLFFMTAGFPDHHLLAIRPDGHGNVSNSHIAWHHENPRYVAYVPSPVSCGDYFLVVSDPGFACCFEASTGKLAWMERFGSHHASLVTAKDLVYFLDDKGTTRVVQPGPEFRLVAENPLDEKCFASPAVSEGQIFIRGFENLYCIGEN